MKKIAVLTSGGDAPGMNAAVRAVVRTALNAGIEVYGVVRGFNGLINDELIPMNLRSVSNILQQGGTMLYTARCLEFKELEYQQKAAEICRKHGIEGVVVCGGDGSFRGAQKLSKQGIPTIGIPCTIDNDIGCCEYTIGYDTATNTVVDLVDKLRDTCQSHDRCSVVEVMGRHAGWLALSAGIAAGATSILVPEVPYDFQKDIVDRMKYTSSLGKHHFIVMVAEGIGDVDKLAKKIEEATGVETRATVLGHVQRGGRPSSRDRLLASQMGYYAAHLLMEGKTERVVAVNNNTLMDFDIDEALAMKKPFKDQLFKMAAEISI
ncbi:MAG: 6-phosphofructokinase [Ruminococcaceae bacterium]|nr:6-phosphofructokinase [Oscillospiraceae bacterium]